MGRQQAGRLDRGSPKETLIKIDEPGFSEALQIDDVRREPRKTELRVLDREISTVQIDSVGGTNSPRKP